MNDWLTAAVLLCAAAPAMTQARDKDRDRDGLSDYLEVHKYRTNPAQADSDRDGLPDGDWRERREFTYTIRTVIQVMPNYDKATLSDGYQDCRVLYECPDYVELEVVHYPLSTVGEAIPADKNWRKTARKMREFVRPGPTTNWDKAMQRDLLARLKAANIDVTKLTDKAVVEKVSRWALRHAKSYGKTCAWAIDFKGSTPFVPDRLMGKFRSNRGEQRFTPAQQFEHELYGRGMYENRTRGTCTTSANYLTTVLRAVGIPTRMILTIPCVDASDARNVAMVEKRLTHHAIRRDIVKGVKRLGNSFAAHTYNEVFVGGRWRRLNYDRLGQPIVDAGFLGMMTKVHTFTDLASAGLGAGWGLGRQRPSDVFRHSNPYTALTISDQFGAHAKLANPEVDDGEHRTLTITRAYWFDDAERRPDLIGADWGRAQDKSVGHLLVHVRECHTGEGAGQYNAFFDAADPNFRLEAKGQAPIPLQALRCWWIDGRRRIHEFYLQIGRRDFARMKRGVRYRLVPRNEGQRRWVSDGIVVTR